MHQMHARVQKMRKERGEMHVSRWLAITLVILALPLLAALGIAKVSQVSIARVAKNARAFFLKALAFLPQVRLSFSIRRWSLHT